MMLQTCKCWALKPANPRLLREELEAAAAYLSQAPAALLIQPLAQNGAFYARSN